MRTETPARSGWGQALRVYVERPVLSMLFLGFSAGLPFFLVFQTLSAWLRKEHIDRATIGMLALGRAHVHASNGCGRRSSIASHCRCWTSC